MREKLFSILKNKLALFLISLTILYHGIFNSYTGQILFNNLTVNTSPGIITGEITYFSLFFGLELQNFSIKKPEEYPIIKIDTIKLNYNLPLLLIGKVQVSDISFLNPEIYIEKKDGIYNIDTLFSSTQKETTIEDVEEKKDIPTILPISFYGNLLIENLLFSYIDRDGEELRISDFTFYCEIKTKRFRKIPLDYSIVELIESFNLKIQEKKKLEITWKKNDFDFSHSIPVYFCLEKKDLSSPWLGIFTFKLEKFTLNVKKESLKPLDLNIDLRIESNNYDLIIENFSFSFQNKDFWKLSGRTEDLRNQSSKMNFSMIESNIDFNLLEPYVSFFDPNVKRIRGNISLSPFKLEGSPENFKIDWSITGKDILILIDKKSHSIPELNFHISSILSILKDTELIFNLNSIKDLNLNITNLSYNDTLIKSSIELNNNIIKGNIIFLVRELKNLTDSVSGNLDLKIEILPSNIYNPEIKVTGDIKRFQTKIGGESLKPSNLNYKIYLSPMISENFEFTSVNMKDSFVLLNRAGKQNSIEFQLPVLSFENKTKFIKIQKLNLLNNITLLSEILPGNLSEQISNLRQLIGNFPEFKIDLDLGLTGVKPITGNLFFFSRGDLNSEFNLSFQLQLNSDGKDSSINIKKIELTGYDGKLISTLSGLIQKNKFNEYKPTLDLSVNIESANYFSLIKNLDFLGKFQFAIQINDKLINGRASSTESYIKLKTGNCPGVSCKNFDLVNIYFNIPIEYNLNNNGGDTILEGNKTEVLKNFYTKSETNFSIEKISGSHPTLEEKTFLFANGIKMDPGLSGRVQFIDNKFTISNLSLKILNGTVSSKSILFHFGNSKPESMEFIGNLQVRDIDLTELLAEGARKNIDDGKIRGDINFSGKNIKSPIDNTEVFFSVYRIGKDFGKSAINVVSPPNLIRDYIVNSYSVDKIEAELSKGLVYITILFKQGILSDLLTKIENNRISQERMPLNNFLNRAQDEISSYNR